MDTKSHIYTAHEVYVGLVMVGIGLAGIAWRVIVGFPAFVILLGGIFILGNEVYHRVTSRGLEYYFPSLYNILYRESLFDLAFNQNHVTRILRMIDLSEENTKELLDGIDDVFIHRLFSPGVLSIVKPSTETKSFPISRDVALAIVKERRQNPFKRPDMPYSMSVTASRLLTPYIAGSIQTMSMSLVFNTSSLLPRKKDSKSQVHEDETRSLLQAASIEEAGHIVEDYVVSQQDDIIDTSQPEIPDIKSIFKFELLGIGLELISAALLFTLCGKYFAAGCLITGFTVLGIGLSVSYLSIPQAVKPFIKNPIIRWFIVSNHSTQITAMFGAEMAFIYVSYLSWFNSCSSPMISKTTISTMSMIGLSVVSFLVACYRDENGNGGYIRWLFKLFV